MRGDFSRMTFGASKHFSRVLKQQGRVTLDADDNEQTAILLHYLRTLARDLIGPYGTPLDDRGFVLGSDGNGGIAISRGHCYVDGILVENESPTTYASQPDYQVSTDDELVAESEHPTGKTFWLYLDVWERHITSIEDDSIREKALGGPDTATRAKVMWQVKALPLQDAMEQRKEQLEEQLGAAADEEKAAIQAEIDQIDAALEAFEAMPRDDTAADPLLCATPLGLLGGPTAGLEARVDPGRKSDDACLIPPDSKYRGAENQLYRVEIHEVGIAEPYPGTFKWSHDNGSVAAAWLGTAGHDLQVSHARGFAAGNWVELSDDTQDLQGTPGVLVKLEKVEGNTLSVAPATVKNPSSLAWSPELINAKVRRWDQVQRKGELLLRGAVPIRETPADADDADIVWIDLEDGIQVRFTAGGEYRTGDYWMIPARVATGKIEWPSGAVRAAQGVEHHYAPLGFVWWEGEDLHTKVCACQIQPLSSCAGIGMRRAPGTRAVETKPRSPAPARTAGGRRKRATPGK